MSVRTFSVKEHKQTHRFKTAIDKNVVPAVISAAGWGYEDGYLEWEKVILKHRLPNVTQFADNTANPAAPFSVANFDGIQTIQDGTYITYPVPRNGSVRCKIQATTVDDLPYSIAMMTTAIGETPYFEMNSGDVFEQVLTPDLCLGDISNVGAPDWQLSVDLTSPSWKPGYYPLTVVCKKNHALFGELDIDVGDYFYFFPAYKDGNLIPVPSVMNIGLLAEYETGDTSIPYGSRLYIIKRKSINNDTDYEYTLSFEPYNTVNPEESATINVSGVDINYTGFYLPYDPLTIKVSMLPTFTEFNPDLYAIRIGSLDEALNADGSDNCRFVFNHNWTYRNVRINSRNLLSYRVTEQESGITNGLHQMLETCYRMFAGCSSLREVQSIYGTFISTKEMFYNCSSLKAAPYIQGNIADAEAMFSGCTALIEASALFGQFVNIKEMFYGCKSLVLLAWFDTYSVTHYTDFLSGCSALQIIPEFDFPSVVYSENNSPLSGNYSLSTGMFTEYRTQDLDLRNTLFSADMLNEIFDRLIDASTYTPSPEIYIAGAVGAGTCDQSIATAKNWVVQTV